MSENSPSKAVLALSAGLNFAGIAADSNERPDARNYTESSHIAKYSPEVLDTVEGIGSQIRIVEESEEAANPDDKMSKYEAFKDDPKALAEAVSNDFPDPIAYAETKVPGITKYIDTERPELRNVLKADMGWEALSYILQSGWGYVGSMGIGTMILVALGILVVGPGNSLKGLKYVTKGLTYDLPKGYIDRSYRGNSKTAANIGHRLFLAAGAAGIIYGGKQLDDSRDKANEAKDKVEESSTSYEPGSAGDRATQEVESRKNSEDKQAADQGNNAAKRLRSRYSNTPASHGNTLNSQTGSSGNNVLQEEDPFKNLPE
ncbi:MAG: hypothetical protein AAB373_05230 [Patescibacteria group bacterium]